MCVRVTETGYLRVRIPRGQKLSELLFQKFTTCQTSPAKPRGEHQHFTRWFWHTDTLKHLFPSVLQN